jgi:hypothetical protein
MLLPDSQCLHLCHEESGSHDPGSSQRMAGIFSSWSKETSKEFGHFLLIHLDKSQNRGKDKGRGSKQKRSCQRPLFPVVRGWHSSECKAVPSAMPCLLPFHWSSLLTLPGQAAGCRQKSHGQGWFKAFCLLALLRVPTKPLSRFLVLPDVFGIWNGGVVPLSSATRPPPQACYFLRFLCTQGAGEETKAESQRQTDTWGSLGHESRENNQPPECYFLCKI